MLQSKGCYASTRSSFFRNQCHHHAAEQERFAARLGKLVQHPTLGVTDGNRSSSLIPLAEPAGPMWLAGGTFADGYPRLLVLQAVVIPNLRRYRLVKRRGRSSRRAAAAATACRRAGPFTAMSSTMPKLPVSASSIRSILTRSSPEPSSKLSIPERSFELSELVEDDEQRDHSGAQFSDCLTGQQSVEAPYDRE